MFVAWVTSTETMKSIVKGVWEDLEGATLAVLPRMGCSNSYGNDGARQSRSKETPQPARSEAPESLFEAVEEGAGALLGHAVHIV